MPASEAAFTRGVSEEPAGRSTEAQRIAVTAATTAKQTVRARAARLCALERMACVLGTGQLWCKVQRGVVPALRRDVAMALVWHRTAFAMVPFHACLQPCMHLPRHVPLPLLATILLACNGMLAWCT